MSKLLSNISTADLINIIVKIAEVCAAIGILSKVVKKILKEQHKTIYKKINKVEKTLLLENKKQNRDNKQHFIKLETAINDNERDRLRQEIFRYGNFCRRGVKISGEEFVYLRDKVVSKYKELGGNDVGDAEWKMIQDYYNNQR